MLEIVALLLPIAAASGWYAAKRHYTRKDSIEPRVFYCGFNDFQHNKSGRAGDPFADLKAQDGETIETHIALGNLFRRRGEVEKAIGIHEKLNTDPKLTEAVKHHASFELGVDYMRAGLFDRAETIFQSLCQTKSCAQVALQQLLQIYQQEKDWQRAIACTRKLLEFSNPPRGENVAQFLCELAEEAAQAEAFEVAADFLAQALRENPNCVRATLILAKLKMASGHYAEALQLLKRVEEQNPAYLAEALPLIAVCYERLNDTQGLMDYLARVFREFRLISSALAFTEYLQCEGANSRTAAEYLLTAMEVEPCLLGIRHASALLSIAEDADQRDMRRVALILSRLVAEIPRYRCRDCGFSGAQLHWRCPSCQSWESITPV